MDLCGVVRVSVEALQTLGSPLYIYLYLYLYVKYPAGRYITHQIRAIPPGTTIWNTMDQ